MKPHAWHGTNPSGTHSQASLRPPLLALLLAFSASVLAFDITNPGGWIEDGVKATGKLNPFDYSSTTSHSSDTGAPPEPAFPCDGKVIRPDSMGNFMFSVQPGGAKQFGIEFSKNGADWNVPINGAMGLEAVQGQEIPVNAGKLLLVGKTWFWRARATAGGKSLLSKRTCKLTIEPSGGAQTLAPPILVSPACGGQVMGNPVKFDAKPGNGTFQIFRAELQYDRMPGGWTNSILLAAIDKNQSPLGVAVPVSELAKHGGKWRWRARLDTEMMPLFGNLTQGQWSPWCEFSVPVANRSASGGLSVPGTMPAMLMPIPTPSGSVAPAPSPAAVRQPPPTQPATLSQPMPVLPNLPAVQQAPDLNRRAR